MDVDVAQLLVEVEKLKARVEELEQENARLKANSSNSNWPPSQDKPADRAKRRSKARSRRKKGGQRGHKGHHRGHKDHHRVHLPNGTAIHLKPSSCQHCNHDLTGEGANPVLHQVVDIPPIEPVITDYHLHRLTCSCCRKTTRAQLPGAVPSIHYGPQLRALLVTLVVAYRISRQQAQQLVNHVCQIPMSPGTVSNLERRAIEHLDPLYHEAQQAIEPQPSLRCDETTLWLRQGRRGPLWVACCDKIAFFVIDPSRSRAAFQRLIGSSSGILAADRFKAYEHWPLETSVNALANRQWIQEATAVGIGVGSAA